MSLLKVEDNFQATIVGNYSTSASTIRLSAVPVLRTAGYLTVFDFDGNQFEKIKFGGVSSNDITSVLRGLSFSDNSDTEITANKKELKNGMAVKMSVSQNYHNDIVDRLNGTTPVDAVMKNPATRVISNSRHLVDKEYADAISSSGIIAMLVSSGTGLTFNVNAGIYLLNGAVKNYAGAAAQALTDNATNYIELTDGVLAVNTVGFDDDSVPLAQIVCLSGAITSVLDKRPFYTGVDIKANNGLGRDATGIYIDLATDPGLEFSGGKLRTKIKASGGIVRDTNGLSVDTNIYPSQVTLPLGETVTAGKPLSFYLSSDNKTRTISQAASDSDYNIGVGINKWFGQTVTTPVNITKLSQVVFDAGTFGSARDYTLHIRATSAGLPTGSDLITPITVTATNGAITFNVSPGLTLSANTKYAFLISINTNNCGVRFQSTDVYPSGERVLSSDSGASWAATTGDFYFTFTYIVDGNKLYMSNSSSNDSAANNFVGFSATSGNYGDNINVINFGIYSGLTSLTPGATYYLSNTSGEISSSAGSQSRKIGLAVSSTSLLIKLDNV